MTRKDAESNTGAPSGSDDNERTDTEIPSPSPELDAIDLEQLGRQRPPVFKNAVYEILFCSSLLVSMFMAVSPLALIHPNLLSRY